MTTPHIDDEAAIANCRICTLGSAIKRCKVCLFKIGLVTKIDAVLKPQEPFKMNVARMTFTKHFAERWTTSPAHVLEHFTTVKEVTFLP